MHLLRRRDFRLVYGAIATSELGDAFQYIALMWFALEAGGPVGGLIVRLADRIRALLFGLHGGLLADRLERRRTMIVAALLRGPSWSRWRSPGSRAISPCGGSSSPRSS